MQEILTLALRTAIIYLGLTIGIRCMGKRQIGEMSTAEIAVTLLIAEVAGAPITDPDTPIHHGLTVIVILVLCELIVSFLDLKLPFFVKLTQGAPSVIIRNGKIIESALKKSRVTLAELNEELRFQNVAISDVYMAIIETNGQLSIIPENFAAGVTRKDLNVKEENDPVDFAVIIDGEIKENNLKLIGKDKNFVYKIVKEKNIKNIKDVLVLYADTKGATYFQMKEKTKGR